jgi:hypothetical protein
MNASVISALAALAGATIGGLTSVLASWLSQHAQARAQGFAQDKLRRQELYKEFIEAASKPPAVHIVSLLVPSTSAINGFYPARSARCSARRRTRRAFDAVGADAILWRYRLDTGSQEASRCICSKLGDIRLISTHRPSVIAGRHSDESWYVRGLALSQTSWL